MRPGRFTLLVCLLALLCARVHAFEWRDVKLLGSLTFDASQGDGVPLSSGDAVAAGQGVGLLAGVEVPDNKEKTFFTQFFAGYKSSHGPLGNFGEFVQAVAVDPFSNGRYAEFDRRTVDLIEQYRPWRGLRVGGGATYQFGMKVRCVEIESGACNSIGPVYPDNALGALAQLSYVWSDRLEAGVRYTRIDYKVGGQRYDGSTWGLFMVLGFHLR